VRIDCQSHVFPRAYSEILAQNPHPPQIIQTGSGPFITYKDGLKIPFVEERYNPELKIRDMDSSGIDISVITVNIPGPCMLIPDLALKGARAINDYMAELMVQYPGRFAGIAHLPWHDVDSSLNEMDRAQNDLALCGVALFSNIGGRPVDDPAFEPLYAKAEEKGLPIVMHPTVPSWGEAIKDYGMVPMIGFQVDSSFALLRLILAGVLERHPRLQVVMPHVGGILPFMIGRIDNATGVKGLGGNHITRPPSEYLRRIYLDTNAPSAEALRYAYEFSGAERLLFGSDHPWNDIKAYVDLVEGMSIPLKEKALIFSGNAKTLFRLD
jgi:predicted TIM-barrel fold metal-dependent hydrolase